MANRIEWTPAKVMALRRQWADGISCSAIARSLGTTKNAVIGKANRLLLPARADNQADAGRMFGGGPMKRGN